MPVTRSLATHPNRNLRFGPLACAAYSSPDLDTRIFLHSSQATAADFRRLSPDATAVTNQSLEEADLSVPIAQPRSPFDRCESARLLRLYSALAKASSCFLGPRIAHWACLARRQVAGGAACSARDALLESAATMQRMTAKTSKDATAESSAHVARSNQARSIDHCRDHHCCYSDCGLYP